MYRLIHDRFNSLFIIGIYSITQEGMIFYFARKIFIKSDADDMEETYRMAWLFKPLVGCPTCMASIHSIYIF
ncbi:MAG: hypothetical protein HRT71_10775 [Flavobacteriales bacterium]|nr:hypothetical protein [Flavobacteriales bacterium]